MVPPTLTILFLMPGIAIAPGTAVATDGGSVADRIAGTWSLVSLEVHRSDDRISVLDLGGREGGLLQLPKGKTLSRAPG